MAAQVDGNLTHAVLQFKLGDDVVVDHRNDAVKRPVIGVRIDRHFPCGHRFGRFGNGLSLQGKGACEGCATAARISLLVIVIGSDG